MKVDAYVRDVLVPANVAVAAIQRAGLPIALELLRRTRVEWLAEIARLEKFVEAKAAEVGTPFKYSAKHGAHPPNVAKFLFKVGNVIFFDSLNDLRALVDYAFFHCFISLFSIPRAALFGTKFRAKVYKFLKFYEHNSVKSSGVIQ